MERSEIYALAKLDANKYHLRKLYLPREEIQEIRQLEGTGYDDLRGVFGGIPPADTEVAPVRVQRL